MVQQLRRHKLSPRGGGDMKKGRRDAASTEIHVLNKLVGDLRKELDLARRVVEAARLEARIAPRGMLGYIVKADEMNALGAEIAAYDAARKGEK